MSDEEKWDEGDSLPPSTFGSALLFPRRKTLILCAAALLGVFLCFHTEERERPAADRDR